MQTAEAASDLVCNASRSQTIQGAAGAQALDNAIPEVISENLGEKRFEQRVSKLKKKRQGVQADLCYSTLFCLTCARTRNVNVQKQDCNY